MRKSAKKKNIIIIILSFLLICLPTIIALFLNLSYESSSFFIHSGVMDINHTEVTNLEKGINIMGDTEFYYNKWLMTDNEEDAEMDTYLSLPNFWTKVRMNGENLPVDGYATYRFKVINLPIGVRLTADSDYYYSSCRIYFDNVLVGQNGTPSKDRKSDVSGINFTQKGSYIITSGEMTVTIEVGNSGHGGIKKGPKILLTQDGTNTKRGRQLLQFILLGIMLECYVILIVTRFIQSGFRKSLLIIAIATFAFLYWLFSGDGLVFFALLNIPIPYMMYKTISIVCLGAFILSSSLYVLHRKNLIPNKKWVFIFIFLTIVFTICRSWFIYNQFFIIFFMLVVLLYASLFFFLYYRVEQNLVEDLYIILFAFLVGVTFLSACDDGNVFFFPLSNALSLGVFIGSIFLYLIFFLRILYFKKKAKLEKSLLKEQNYLNAISTQQQFNPNLMFNAFAIIADGYHRSVDKGDILLSDFSSSLRYSIVTIGTLTVPFSDEVDNTIVFADFHNQRDSLSMNLLLNIDTYEFMFPPTVLTTFVFAFFNHKVSKFNEEDNIFEISTVENKNDIVVQLIDHRGSYMIDEKDEGIDNAVQRLSLTIKAKVIFSKDEKSSIITITIPKIKGGVKDENNSSR